MSFRKIFHLIGRSIDPRRNFENEIPRAFLFSKFAVEYLFRLVGFFVLLCLVVGLTLSSCTQNVYLQLLPLVLAIAFFFYIAITTLGIPCFLLLAEIRGTLVRRLLSYLLVLLLLYLTYYSLLGGGISNFRSTIDLCRKVLSVRL